MDEDFDVRPIMRAMISQLEKACHAQEWKSELLGDGPDAKPPKWVLDTRRTLNEAKAALAILDGMEQRC